MSKDEVNKRTLTARNTFYDIDLAQFIDPYKKLAEEYNNLYFIKKQRMKLAYLVTFKDDPSLIFFAFAANKEKSKAQYSAVKYFKESMHPFFMGDKNIKNRIYATQMVRYPAFDKYAEEGRIPIVELFKIGIRFPCYCCKKHSFNQQLLNLKKCYIIEGEGNVNAFTKGFVLCKDCYDKFYGK